MEEFSKIMANSFNVNLSMRGQAEQQMESIILDTFNLDLFLKYLLDPNYHISLKQAAALFLMRYIKEYWYDDSPKAMEFPQKVISNETKEYFQKNILTVMLSVEPKLLQTLKDTIVMICNEGQGYYNCWPELMNILGKILQNKDPKISVDIYDLIQKITKRYRSEFGSNSLIREMINTIKEIAGVLTEDGVLCITFIYSDQKSNRDMAVLYLTILKHILNIFISLNSQDFPEFFEDNLSTWINILKSSLEFSLTINSGDLIMNNLFLKVKKVAMKSLNLYCKNYYEDIHDYHNEFYPAVWNLVTLIKHTHEYEKLIKELLDYYKNIFQYNRASGFDSQTVQHLINHLILPEMKLTQRDLEEFEENAINFLKVELEETDMDSNKYHAINLLKNLLKTYTNMNNEYINPLINNYLTNYYQNPQKNWMDKISAINLIFATMIQTFTQKFGVTDIRVAPEDIRSLIESVFLKEFNEVTAPHYIARIYSLKFLSTFRLQIPQDWLNSIINMLVNILKQSDNIIQTATLLTLEKILFMRDINTNTSLAKEAVNNQETFIELIGTLVKISSSSINIFAMRCLFRTVFLTSEAYYKPILESLSISINEILKNIIANPAEDQFNYFLFETIAMIMKKLNLIDKELFKFFVNSINGNLLFIMENGITDLLGYVFQIFAQMLGLFSDGEAFNDQLHKNLITNVLNEENSWVLSMKFLFNPMASYLRVSFAKCRGFYETNKPNLDQVFKIINKLLELKSYTLAFDVLDQLLNVFDLGLIFENLKGLFYNFMVIYNNLKINNRKAYIEFSKILLTFLAKIIIKTNSKVAVELLENVNQGLTVALLTELSEFIMDVDIKDKKLVVYSYCMLIVDFYSSFDEATLKLFTWKLIQTVSKFNRINDIGIGGIDKLLEPGQNLSYSENSYNKLLNADIKVDQPDYQKVIQMDMVQLIFEAVNKVKQATSLDLISGVFPNLTEKEKSYIQNASNTYNK